jgi:hypothetical protein
VCSKEFGTPWISVKDRLPDTEGDYLVWVRYANPQETEIESWYEIAYRTRECTIDWFFDCCTDDKSEVLYWTPLPEPPEVKDER